MYDGESHVLRIGFQCVRKQLSIVKRCDGEIKVVLCLKYFLDTMRIAFILYVCLYLYSYLAHCFFFKF